MSRAPKWLSRRRLALVLAAALLLLALGRIVRDIVAERRCAEAGLDYAAGRCVRAPPPVIIQRDLQRT
jgi:hypothetical protein